MRNPGASVFHVAWWEMIRAALGVWLKVVYRMKVWDREKLPLEGPVLLICNHQSFLDLMVIGVAIRGRHFHSMARKTLFNNRWFGWLIRSLNAIELDQTRGDLKAIRTALDRLAAGHLVLIFPEGSRTLSGEVGPFQPGTMLLIRRAKPIVVPMALEGPFHIWPRGGRLRWRGRIGVSFGDPIPGETLAAMSPDEALAVMKRHVESALEATRRRMCNEKTE